MKTTSVEPLTKAAMLPIAPVTVISASPASSAAVTIGDDEMKTMGKSRLYFLKMPASSATHGNDWDMTREELTPTSLSGTVGAPADVASKTLSSRKAIRPSVLVKPLGLA